MDNSRQATAIDSFLPVFDVRSAHQIQVDAPVENTYRAVRDLDVGRSLPIMVLFAIRSVPHVLTGKMRPSRSVTLESMLDMGFVVLDDRPPWEFAMGAVGKFWRPDSGMLHLSADEFRDFAAPGFAKAVMTFSIEPDGSGGSLLATETRVGCTDASARRKFQLYWKAIGPFSGVIRQLMLAEVKRAAEEAASATQ